MFLISLFLQPITIGFPEERELGYLGGGGVALEVYCPVCRVSTGVVFLDGGGSGKLPSFLFSSVVSRLVFFVFSGVGLVISGLL